MTQKEFIKVLDKKGYSYKMEGDRIIVTHGGIVDLGSLTSLPSGVVFKNEWDVYLNALTSLPPDVAFRNDGGVYFQSLTSIPPGVEFSNGMGVYLNALIGGYFTKWKGNIEGIDSKRLFDFMINKGVFER